MQDTHHMIPSGKAGHIIHVFNYNKFEVSPALVLLYLDVLNRGVWSFLPWRIWTFSSHSGSWNKNLPLFQSLEIVVSSHSPCCIVIVALHSKDYQQALHLRLLFGNRQSNLDFLLDPICLIQISRSVKNVSNLREIWNLQDTVTVSDNSFPHEQYCNSLDLPKSADPSCSGKCCTTLSLEQHTNQCMVLYSWGSRESNLEQWFFKF